MDDKKIKKNKTFFLECEDIVKIYSSGPVSITALRGINFRFESGKIYVIFGPSGSGKTTLLSIIGGLLLPSSGIINLNNKYKIDSNTNELFKYRKNNISFIFQEAIFIPFLNATENIKFLTNKTKKNSEKNQVSYVLEKTNLLSRKLAYPYQLSGGEKQRLSISMGLFLNKKIWLCDEPTGTLDSENKSNIMNLLQQIVIEDPSKIMIIVTHDPLFYAIANEILVLEDGLIKSAIKEEEIEKFKQKSLIYQATDEKLKETIKKENILKRLEEIKKELTKD